MQLLSEQDVLQISGGVSEAQMVVMGIAGFAGGWLLTEAVSYLDSLSTLFATVGAGVGGAVVCTPFFPVVGTVVCGSAGALTGYFCGAMFAKAGAFILGAAGSAAGVYALMA